MNTTDPSNEITIVAAIKSFPILLTEYYRNRWSKRITETYTKSRNFFKINTGMYILEPIWYRKSRNDFFGITTLIENVHKEGRRKVSVFPLSWKAQGNDIGNMEVNTLIKV